MEALRLNLMEVMAREKEARFIIPQWQRHYVWTDKEISQMWGDWHLNCTNDQKHFCGVMLFQKMPTDTNFTLEIVDGQQRMTTFFLFFIALRDVCDDKDIDFGDLNGIFTLPDSQACRLVLLQGANDDRDVMNALLSKKLDHLEKHIIEDSLLNKGYRYFRQKLSDKPVEEILTFVSQVLTNVDFVVLTVDPDDNPRRIFEALNSRGKQVDQVELVANLIRFAGESDEEMKDLSKAAWVSICDLFEQDEKIAPFLDAFSKRHGSIGEWGDVFDKIKLEVDQANKENKLRYWLREFKRAGENYYDVLHPEGAHDVTKVLLKELNRLRVGKLNPFLLALLESFRDTPAGEPLIHNVISTIVRMLINFDRPTYKLEKFAEDACSAFHNQNISREEQLNKIIALIDGIWVDDATFHAAFTRKSVYGPGAHLSRLRYYLEKFEQKLAEEKKIPFETQFGNQTTVEHIMPQTLDKDGEWKKALKTTDMVRLEAQHRAMVHTIGNLTVLLTSVNPAAGNTPYPVKREFYLHPNEFLNKHGSRKRTNVIGNCCLNSYFEDAPVWNFQTIAIRSQWMADLALKIWNKQDWNLEIK